VFHCQPEFGLVVLLLPGKTGTLMDPDIEQHEQTINKMPMTINKTPRGKRPIATSLASKHQHYYSKKNYNRQTTKKSHLLSGPFFSKYPAMPCAA